MFFNILEKRKLKRYIEKRFKELTKELNFLYNKNMGKDNWKIKEIEYFDMYLAEYHTLDNIYKKFVLN